jgi:hypothetical protein
MVLFVFKLKISYDIFVDLSLKMAEVSAVMRQRRNLPLAVY